MVSKVTVVGAGIIGLSVAHSLQDKGHDVEILTRETTPYTTSDVAAAFWLPYKAAPVDKVKIWSQSTYNFLKDNVIDLEGVSKLRLKFLCDPVRTPMWVDFVDNLGTTKEDLPKGYTTALEFDSFLMESSHYLPALTHSFQEKGGKLTIAEINNLDVFDSNIVVNCTGLGAADLVGDSELYPLRGQVLTIPKKMYSNDFGWVDDDLQASPLCVIPRESDVVVGVTTITDDGSLEVRDTETNDIVSRAQHLLPEITNKDVLGIKVGLRPARSEVRLEKEVMDTKTIIHCYGHGGAGFSLSWGCAQEVVSLIEESE